MGKKQRIITANDNLPDIPITHTARPFEGRPNPRIDTSADLLHSQTSASDKPKTQSNSLKITFLVWISCLGFFLSVFITQGNSFEIKAFSSIALLWTGLWTSYVAADHRRWRLSEISIITAIMGLMGSISQGLQYLGVTLTLFDNIFMMSILALMFGYFMKSRMAILTSILATLLWATMSFTGIIPFNSLIVLFPILTLAQIYTSTRIASKIALGLALFTGYLTLTGFLLSLWVSNVLPLTYASSLLFIIGVAHHRSGKAAEDRNIAGSHLHIYCGWVVAVIGAIIFQHFWLEPNAAVSSSAILSPASFTIWKIIIGLSILTIFISGIIRFKYTQITLIGIFLLTVCSALIPMMMWLPNLPEVISSEVPGMNAIPAFGIMIGAGISAIAIGMTLNGMRRHSTTMIGLGLMVLITQAYLLLSPDLMSVDNIIIFGTTFISALAISGAIAGNSLAFQAPPPRLKAA